MDLESSKRRRSFHINNNNENENVIPPQSVSNRRLSRPQQSNEMTSSTNDLSINSQKEELTHNQIRKMITFILNIKQKVCYSGSDVAVPDPVFSSKNTYLTPFCLIT
jgi:hypothetical protein